MFDFRRRQYNNYNRFHNKHYRRSENSTRHNNCNRNIKSTKYDVDIKKQQFRLYTTARNRTIYGSKTHDLIRDVQILLRKKNRDFARLCVHFHPQTKKGQNNQKLSCHPPCPFGGHIIKHCSSI